MMKKEPLFLKNTDWLLSEYLIQKYIKTFGVFANILIAS